MIQWATVFFDFSVEEVLIASSFPSTGGAKVLNARIFYFTGDALLIFALHPLMGKIKKYIDLSKGCREKSNCSFDFG